MSEGGGIENEGFRLHAWGAPLRWERWRIPTPGPGEVQVEVEACGVGQTVLNSMRGDNWNDPDLLPRVPGHEVVGRVVATGPGVHTPSVGDRVLAYFYLSCFSCARCRAGDEASCERLAGRYGVHRDGGYARRTNLPAGNAIPCPAGIDAGAATVIPDAVATSVHVCRGRLALRPGERLAVIGAGGGVGSHLIQVGTALGARVVGLDRTPDKLALIEGLGAVPIDSTGFDGVELEDWDGVADAVVDLVGSRESFSWALGRLGEGGRLCVLSAVPGIEVPVAPRDLVLRETSVLGSHYASRREVAEAARMVSDGRVRPVVEAVGSPPDVEDLHERIRAGELLGRGAIVWEAAQAA